MVVPSIDIALGGPSYSSVNLCRALSMHGVAVTLLTTKPAGPVPPGTGRGFNVQYFPRSFPARFGNSRELIAALRANAKRYDLLHLTNLWNAVTTRAAWTAHRLGLPYVLTPRGMLSAWSRSLRRLDKEFYFAMAEERTIRRAACLHFLTGEEAKASARFLRHTPQCIIPNGVWLDESRGADPEGFRARFDLGGKRCVLFLGRLHPIKRLDLQCEALAILSPKFPDLRWVFAGPDDGVQKRLMGYLRAARLEGKVVFTGLLSGLDRISALAAADVYCQTSDHEGHSVAITEALAAGRPCVVTQSCNFEAIGHARAGFVVPSTPAAIADAADQLLNDRPLASTMARNAVQLIEETYTWQAVAQRMMAAYAGVLGHSQRS